MHLELRIDQVDWSNLVCCTICVSRDYWICSLHGSFPQAYMLLCVKNWLQLAVLEAQLLGQCWGEIALVVHKHPLREISNLIWEMRLGECGCVCSTSHLGTLNHVSLEKISCNLHACVSREICGCFSAGFVLSHYSLTYAARQTKFNQ